MVFGSMLAPFSGFSSKRSETLILVTVPHFGMIFLLHHVSFWNRFRCKIHAEASMALLGRSCAFLGGFCALLRRSWVVLGPFLAALGPLLLGSSWALLGCLGLPRGVQFGATLSPRCGALPYATWMGEFPLALALCVIWLRAT